ncbi:restriction endonuclease subunit S [Butyrivibrio sp. AC2005]|uniref:restriction endonuclease subunit S n=1 Tax=Butyrivibrio sp. AC2005 TaxID=1280672 RepID=UPI00041363D3|nr:restriction endonuclease subunit S [Butyrivibrio sp. AC2005]
MANTPNIRFKGFTDAWEQRKVTELGEIYIGLVTTMTSHYTDHGALLIRNSDIKDGRFEFGDNPIYLDDEFAKQNASRKHKVGDVITVHTGDIGTSAVITEKEAGSIGFATIVTRPDKEKIASEYLCAYLNTDTHKNFAMNISTGDGRNNYNLKDYYECVVPVPSIAEQRKISSFIDELNNLIALHQRKCDETKELKKYMLQKMLPKKGEKKPEIRFSGFTDDWEQRKLSDLIIEYKETVDSDCTLPILTSSKTEGVVLQEEHFGRVQNHDITGYNILPRNYCTYRNRSDGVDFTFNINRCCDKGIISKFYPVFYGNNSDIFFISMVLNYCDEVVHEIAYTCTGTGQKVLSFLDLQKMNIRVPSYDEQKKISQFFEQLDNLITLHQRKCDELKEVKKYMLQNMFPKKG